MSALRDIMKVWTMSDQDSERKIKKVLEAGLDVFISEAESDVLSMLKKGSELSVAVKRWMEEEQYPGRLTAQATSSTNLRFTGTVLGTSLSSVTTTGTEVLEQVLREGTILYRESDGVQAEIQSVAGLSGGSYYDATVTGYGNTTITTDSAATDWTVLSSPWNDLRDVEDPRSLDRAFRKVGSQIFEESFRIPKTRKVLAMEKVPDEAEHQIAALLKKMRRELGRVVLHSRPRYSGGSYLWGMDETQTPTMAGLYFWPEYVQSERSNTEIYIDASSQPLEKVNIDNLLKGMWLSEGANFMSGDWKIVVHPDVARQIGEFDESYRRMTQDSKTVGYGVEKFFSVDLGKEFPIVSDPYALPTKLMVADFAEFEYGYVKDDAMDRKEIATKGRYWEWMLSFQAWGVMVRRPRQTIGTIYSLSTS